MFRFTIRDLLWLTVVVAVTLGLGIGWLKDRNRLAEEINDQSAFHHSELQRVEREVTAAWMNELIRLLESRNVPSTDNRP